jgi:hypothetical protein
MSRRSSRAESSRVALNVQEISSGLPFIDDRKSLSLMKISVMVFTPRWWLTVNQIPVFRVFTSKKDPDIHCQGHQRQAHLGHQEDKATGKYTENLISKGATPMAYQLGRFGQ